MDAADAAEATDGAEAVATAPDAAQYERQS